MNKHPFFVTGTLLEYSGPDELTRKGIPDAMLAFTVLVEKCNLPEGKLPPKGSPVSVEIHDLTKLEEEKKEDIPHEPDEDGRVKA